MKIALLTIWHERNYGAELQAYATIKILKQLGHEVEIIDIRLSDMHKLSLRARFGTIISSLGPSHRKFEHFWNAYFPKTRRYHSKEELKSNPPNADVYMVGSDQVWNPHITRSFADLFFLNFGLDSVRRISYASSFGTEAWSDYKTEEIRKFLNGFQSLSCRENSGVRILKEVFCVDSSNVLDPTLLFNNYKELTEELTEENTLVYYPLSCFPQLSEYAVTIASKLGLAAKNANWKTYIYGSAVWDRNSVEGWIKDIGQAKFVITPSFHGLAMSLIHHRQFAVIVANKQRATRMVSLLEQLGLLDRIYSSFKEMETAQPWNHKIDYDKVDVRLSYLRTSSINYLKDSLKE